MKKLLIGLGVVVLVLVLLVAAVIFYIDHLAKAGVEYGAKYAMGVDTTLGSASVGLTSGQVTLNKLTVSNPSGFKTSHFLQLDRAHVEVSLGSLRQDVVEVPLLELTNIDLNLEKGADGKANYQVILDNLKKLSASKTGQPAPQPQPAPSTSPGKKFKFRKIVIKDVKVHADLAGFGGKITRTDVEIPELVLTNLGSDDKAVAMDQASGVITQAILLAVAKKGLNLPGEIIGELGQGLANLPSLGEMGVKGVGELGQAIEGVGQKLGEGVGQAVKGVEDVGKQIGKGLGDLLGGEKKKE